MHQAPSKSKIGCRTQCHLRIDNHYDPRLADKIKNDRVKEARPTNWLRRSHFATLDDRRRS
jgi:hypothetical protein